MCLKAIIDFEESLYNGEFNIFKNFLSGETSIHCSWLMFLILLLAIYGPFSKSDFRFETVILK